MKSNQVTTANKVAWTRCSERKPFSERRTPGDNGKKSWERGLSSSEDGGIMPGSTKFARNRGTQCNGVSASLFPSDSTWLLPELGAGRITHVEVPLKCAFAVHASKHARPRTRCALLARPSSSGVSTCTSGTCGRSRTSLQLDCRSIPRTLCPRR